MNREQHLQLIESINKLSLDVQKINKQVSSVVVIPSEIEKWYHLLHYIKLCGDSGGDSDSDSNTKWAVFYRHQGGSKCHTFTSVSVESVHYDQQWVVFLDGDITLCLKDIIDIHVCHDVHETKRAKMVSKYTMNNHTLYPEYTSPGLDINNLPAGIEMTPEQFELVQVHLRLKEVFGCAVIKKPTLRLDGDCDHKWFLQVVVNHGCYSWYFSPEEATEQLNKNKQAATKDSNHFDMMSIMKYRERNAHQEKQLNPDIIQQFLKLLQTTYSKLQHKGFDTHRPMIKVDRGHKIESVYIDQLNTFDLSNITCLLTEWNEPYDLTRDDLDIGFMQHRMFVMYSWTSLTNGWFDAERLPVPTLYYVFKWIFHSDASGGSFVTNIAGIDLVVEALKYELEHTKRNVAREDDQSEHIRLMHLCFELIPMFFEMEDSGCLERIGYNVKNMLSEWFDHMMFLSSMHNICLQPDWAYSWGGHYIDRVFNIYDIHWMLDNFVLWSDAPQQFWNRAFSVLNLSKCKHMSRDNLALVKRMAAGKHSAVDALLKVASSKPQRYLSRLSLIQQAGCRFLHDIRFSEIAYKPKDDSLLQLIYKFGGTIVNKTIEDIILSQDVQLFKLFCLEHTAKGVVCMLYSKYANAEYSSDAFKWALDQLRAIEPHVQT